MLVLVGGEQETFIRDDASTNTAISGYNSRDKTAVTLFGDTIYLIRVRLDCPSLYGRDSLETDCNFAHHVDLWIDLNDDGKYDESESRVHLRSTIDGETPTHGYDLQIIIPGIDGMYTKAGQHRMRLGVMRSEAYRRNCGGADHSDTREYIVNIIPRRKCAGKIRTPIAYGVLRRNRACAVTGIVRTA